MPVRTRYSSSDLVGATHFIAERGDGEEQSRRAPRGGSSGDGIKLHERCYFVQQASEGKLVFQDQVVAAFERNEPSAWNGRSHPPPRFKGHPRVMAGVHNQCGNAHFGQECGHVCFACRHQIACGILRRRRDSLQLIEPIGLLLRAGGGGETLDFPGPTPDASG